MSIEQPTNNTEPEIIPGSHEILRETLSKEEGGLGGTGLSVIGEVATHFPRAVAGAVGNIASSIWRASTTGVSRLAESSNRKQTDN